VRFGSHTPSLDSTLIDWFKQQEQQQHTQPQTPSDLFTPGALVTILHGPFAGLEAVYEMPKSSDRAMLLISVLGRQTRLQCHWHDISPAGVA
jgi:transcriptional antiterminator RfaH